MAKTLVNLRDDVETRLGDTTNTIWTEAELTSYIKEGYDELCLQTLILWKRDTSAIAETDGTATYALPSDLLKLDRLEFDSQRMTPLTAMEARQHYPYFLTVEGTPHSYVYELDGVLTVRLIPIPSTTGTETVLEYFRRGAALSADATELQIPDRYTDYIVWFALGKAYEREGKGQDLEMSSHYMARYNEGIKRIKRRKSQVLASRIGRFGGGDQTPVRTDPWPPEYGRVVRVRY